MSKLQSLFISMEDDNLNETELVVAADDTIEIEIADASEAEVEANEAADGADELSEISEGLESIVASMEASMQDGGLTPQSAQFMALAVGAYTNRLGVQASQITPSLESFGGASGQAAATTISMEGIKETLKKIWLAIKNAVAKAIQAIRNFFAKIFGGVAKLKSRAEALKKEVTDLAGEAGGKIKVPNANTLRYKGKADTKAIVAGLKATTAMAGETYGEVVERAKMYYKVAKDKVLNRAELNDAADAEVKAALGKASEDCHKVFEKIVAVSNVMSGDAVFRVTAVKDSEHGAASSLSIPNLVKGYGFKAVDDTASEIDAPKKSDLLAIVGEAQAMLVQMEGKKASLEGLSKAREEVLKETDKKVEGWGAKMKEGGKQALASLIMRKVNMDVTRPVNQLYSHQFAVVRASLALVERSVAAHKKGADKK